MDRQRLSPQCGPDVQRCVGDRRRRSPRTTAVVLFVVLAALGLVSAGCSTGFGGGTDNNVAAPAEDLAATEAADDPAADPEAPSPVDPVPELVAAMSQQEKVGQLLMPMVFGTGTTITAAEQQLNLDAHGYATPAEIVSAYGLGGVIYLEANIDSAPQLKGLSRQLQDAALAGSGIGLLVAIDQEGGRVSRLSDEVTLFPPASDLAGDPRLVRETSYITGQQVQQQGINVVLAPVADVVEPGQVSFIGNRSFGSDPEVVADMVAAAVDGLQQSGVAAAVKHWPGHGATRVDSHNSLPTVDVDRALWDQRERVPFAAAIEEDVAIVLVGHLAMPSLDGSALPATVSPTLINGLLRSELGFDGVVMSDALNMGAVGDIPRSDVVVESVLAGVDIVLIPPSLKEASAGLNQAVEDGTISTEVLDQAVVRVLRLKQNLGLLPAR
ncbi:MAG: glycoside hydrolase family 3 protein [Acidimicrobiales bacterium]